ncbi:hypothetical protein [Alloactinosynnema sp. L-07]|uniref:hypothetical protein n=1 Tax=Alloactinosynnema sp. L-07 TaxID=1653480 RepID=UPI00065EF1ED|nr:hypothetical protein [Alloactinosynnema sp. L-07]CRK55289.1 hypothetical protein [Alloactinosynnema sp. L-07]
MRTGPAARPRTGDRPSYWRFERTGGMIGSLSQLVRGAAVLAIDDGEAVTRELLDLVPVDEASFATRSQRRKRARPAPAPQGKA